MKKTLWVMTMLAAVLCFAACQKEHSRRGGGGVAGGGDFDYGNATGKHIVQETAVGPEGEKVVVRYNWDGTQLMAMSIADSLNVSLDYSGSKITTMTYDFGAMLQTYNVTYTGERITAITTSMGGMETRYTYGYDVEGHLTSMTQTMVVSGYEIPHSYYFTWQNGNMTYMYDDYGNWTRYQYDSHPSPYTLDFPEVMWLIAPASVYALSANNPTLVEWQDEDGHEARVVNWTYTGDGYPASNGRSDVGFNYYLYADGDGGTVPTGGGTVTPGIMTSLVGTVWEHVEGNYSETFSFFDAEICCYTEYENGYVYEGGEYNYFYSNGRGYIDVGGEQLWFTVNGDELIPDNSNWVFYRIQ